MVYIDPREAAKVRARKEAIHQAEVARRKEANRQAMAYVALAAKKGK